MKKLKIKHNLYGTVAFFCLIAMLGIAGSSDVGRFENSPLLFIMMALLFGIVLLSGGLFRATGNALFRKRGEMQRADAEKRADSPWRAA